MAYPTFSALLSAATAKALAVSPQAAFYEADGTAPVGASTYAQVPLWRFVYTVADSGNGDIHTILVNSVPATGTFVVQTSPQFWVEDRVIDPATVKIPLEEATTLLFKAVPASLTKFKAVTLRWPLYPFSDNGFWFFSFGPGVHYAVNYVTGEVTEVK